MERLITAITALAIASIIIATTPHIRQHGSLHLLCNGCSTAISQSIINVSEYRVEIIVNNRTVAIYADAYIYVNGTWTRLGPGLYMVNEAVIRVFNGVAYIIPNQLMRIGVGRG